MNLKHFLPILAICVVSGALTWTGSEALAAGKRCSDTHGSVLALHSRTLCKDVSKTATARNLTNNVKVACLQVERTKSTCTWSYTLPTKKVTCYGKAELSGVAHVRIRYRDKACVA